MMKARIKDIRLELARNWLDTRRLFWLPQDFQSWPESWQGLVLRFNGSRYEFRTGPVSGALPRPDNYHVGRTRDREPARPARCSTSNWRSSIPGLPLCHENKGIVFFLLARA